MSPSSDNSSPPLDRIEALLSAREQRDLTAVEMDELDRLIREEPQARRFYARYIVETIDLLDWAACADLQKNKTNPATASVERSIGSEIPQDAMTSPIPPISIPLGGVSYNTLGNLASGWLAAYLIAAMICGVGLTIAAFTYVSQPTDIARHSNHSNPQSQIPNSSSVVARITGTADCRWEKREGLGIRDRGLEEGSRSKDQGSRSKKLKSPNPQIPKSLVFLGDQFILSAGLMEITYNTGARVILQGPCTYEVDSAAGGFLEIGKLTARVEQGTKYGVRSTKRVASGQSLVASESSLTTNHYPLTTNSNPQSLIPNPLFAVRTPTAIVTDLGTEFGVEVDGQGGTTSQVFRGSVRVETIADESKGHDDARVLRANEAVRVERSNGANSTVVLQMFAPSARPTFIRELPKPEVLSLDLVDVVAGGDGFSGKRDAGIDLTTGRPVVAPPKEHFFVTDRAYHPVSEMPFVDGVFIPFDGVVQLDSAGHEFSEFSHINGEAAEHVWACGKIPAPDGFNQTIPTTLINIDYASPGHGFLFMHANKGVTFDLDAIRLAHPNRHITRFKCVAGNVGNSLADLWVFVDGRVRFRRWQINNDLGGQPIDIALSDNERFLTLVATDSGDAMFSDWVLFGDPRLELVPANSPIQSKAEPDAARRSSKP